MTMKDSNNANTNENKEHETPTITTKIGSTTYVVGLHFSKTSKENLARQDKTYGFRGRKEGKLVKKYFQFFKPLPLTNTP